MRFVLAALILAAPLCPVLAQEPAAPLPRPRPEAVAPAAPAAEQPSATPRNYQTACPAVLSGRVTAEVLPPLREGQCVATSPLSVTALSVNGRSVLLSAAAITDCGMATVLPDWVEAVDSFLWARENAHIAELLAGTSYMCRNVNNGTGGNLSFHGVANALDVIGFRLDDGRTVTVEAGWSDARSDDGRLLRFAHDAACGIFTTTLGPDANAAHADHFHLDLGCHGQSCTARLCD